MSFVIDIKEWTVGLRKRAAKVRLSLDLFLDPEVWSDCDDKWEAMMARQEAINSVVEALYLEEHPSSRATIESELYGLIDSQDFPMLPDAESLLSIEDSRIVLMFIESWIVYHVIRNGSLPPELAESAKGYFERICARECIEPIHILLHDESVLNADSVVCYLVFGILYGEPIAFPQSVIQNIEAKEGHDSSVAVALRLCQLLGFLKGRPNSANVMKECEEAFLELAWSWLNGVEEDHIRLSFFSVFLLRVAFCKIAGRELVYDIILDELRPKGKSEE
jgi:hypothetical protein